MHNAPSGGLETLKIPENRQVCKEFYGKKNGGKEYNYKFSPHFLFFSTLSLTKQRTKGSLTFMELQHGASQPTIPSEPPALDSRRLFF